MASTRLIETLIVKLGLDPAGFTKGQKQAAAAAIQTEDTVKKSSEAQSSYLGKLTAKWLTVAGAAWALKKAVSTIDDVAERTRRLGIDSKNYDMAAASLRNFENAVQMFGGNTEEARKTVNGFNKALFDLAYRGQMDQSLIMLARLGVQFQTATGDARDFKSVVLDTADAIAAAQDQGMSRANAFQYLQQAGFDAGTSQMILAGRAQAEAALAAQEKRRQVSDTDVGAATGIIQSRTGMRQAREGAEIEFMQSAAGKALEATRNAAEELLTPSGAAEAAGKVADAFGKVVDKVKNFGTALDNISVKAAGSRGMRNRNPINLRAVGDQAADPQGFRVFRTQEEGIRAAEAQLERYSKRGINTLEEIISTRAPPSENDTKAYIANMVAQTGIQPNEVVDSSMRAILLGAMARHESGPGAPDSGQIADALQGAGGGGTEFLNSAGSATPTPAAQTGATYNKTDVQIDSILVQTQAKDAEGVANGMDAAVKRKLLASHAEQGMQ